MDVIKLVRDWVKEVYSNADHLLRTEYWLLKLDPKADSASRIAAFTHDIERAFSKGRKPPSPETAGAKWDDPIYNLWHGKRSARFVGQFLKVHGASKKLANKVKRLIISHEIGGDPETDFLKDADSVSFLEINAPLFFSQIPEKLSKQEVKEKFDYMFNRISSEKARKLALPFYKKALNDLEICNKNKSYQIK